MIDNLPSMVINPEDQPESIDTYIDSLEVRIKQLEEKYNDLIKINDVAMEMIIDLRGQVKMLEGKDE